MSNLVYTIEKEGKYKKVKVENPIATKFGTGVVYKVYLGEHMLGYQVELGLRKTVGDVSLNITRATETAELIEKELRDKMKKIANS